MTGLGFKCRLTAFAHTFKACTKQDHRDLIPYLSRLIDRDSVILDVGGHAGQFAKLFARLAPNGHVYAFEPGSYALSILRTAIWVNRLRNVTILPYGLGDTSGEVTLSVPIKPSGSIGFGLSHLGPVHTTSSDDGRRNWSHINETIQVRTIDEFVKAEHIDSVGFLKADIEGWEMRMLAGAESMISSFRPPMMIEVVDEYLRRAGDSSKKVFSYLRGSGYRSLKIDMHRGRFVEVTSMEDGNIFFVPDDKAMEILRKKRHTLASQI